MILDTFSENDWNHMHDCILHATWNTSKTKSTKEELVHIFNNLPEYLKQDAYYFGMSDTLWRDKFIEYYGSNNENQIIVMEKEKLIIGEDMICPVTKQHCDDECCTVGSECNVSGNEISDISKSENKEDIQQDWIEISPRKIRTFQLAYDPEILHIIPLISKNQYVVFYEDAYELEPWQTGSRIMTAEEVFDKYKIKL